MKDLQTKDKTIQVEDVENWEKWKNVWLEQRWYLIGL